MIPDELKRMTPMKGKERLGAHRDSEYLGAEDIDPDTEPVLTISNLYYGTVTLQRGKEDKDVIAFAEEKVPGINQVRPLIVNATNRKMLKRLYHKVDAETLVGKRIQLYVEHNVRDPSTGDKTDGIRVRAVIPKAVPQEPVHKCSMCGNALTPAGGMGVTKLAEYTKDKYGQVLCGACAKKEAVRIKHEEEARAAQQAEQAENAAENTPETEEKNGQD